MAVLGWLMFGPRGLTSSRAARVSVGVSLLYLGVAFGAAALDGWLKARPEPRGQDVELSR
jgi:hypothetical protein